MSADPANANESPVWLADLGRVEYGAAYRLQRYLAAERDAERVPDLLLLVEHPPVITLGRRGSRDHIYATDEQLAADGVAVYETNRGGLVTYHGPGQIVGYPIVRLRPFAGDAPTYVSGLEETIVRVLAEYGVRTRRDPENRGVFADMGPDRGKVAAIGVAVTHGVTMHGFAVNVHPTLRHFQLIKPCGLADVGVTSVERLTGHRPDLAAVRQAVAFHFGRQFGRAIEPAPPSFWDAIAPLVGAPSGAGAASGTLPARPAAEPLGA